MYTIEAPFFHVVQNDISAVGTVVIDFKKTLAAKDVAGMKWKQVGLIRILPLAVWDKSVQMDLRFAY